MAEDTQVISNIFAKKEHYNRGIYALRFSVKVLSDWKEVIVIIDDFILTLNDTPVMLEAAAWVHLIRKAKAKLCGTYQKYLELEQSSEEIFRELTGAKTECYEIKGM